MSCETQIDLKRWSGGKSSLRAAETKYPVGRLKWKCIRLRREMALFLLRDEDVLLLIDSGH